VAPEHVEAALAAGAVVIGESTGEHWLHLTHRGTTLVDSALADLKPLWQNGLTPYY
jgi:phosphoribosylformylglycinamidine synthase